MIYVVKKGDTIFKIAREYGVTPTRIEILNGYYAIKNEDERLTSKIGSVEFLTTIKYIEKYLQKGMVGKIIQFKFKIQNNLIIVIQTVT